MQAYYQQPQPLKQITQNEEPNNVSLGFSQQNCLKDEVITGCIWEAISIEQ